MWSDLPDSTKWAAALIDPGIWMFPYSMWLNHKAKKEKEGKD